MGAPKQGSGAGTIYYLLDRKRVENETAKILYGSKKEILDLINAMNFKDRVTFGVLSFEERDITDDQKTEIMKDFEKTLFPNLEREKNYKILWVEHTDKGRLELNFVIPKIEIQSGKSLNVFYHKADQWGIEAFQQYTNLKYGFSDPQDPAKKQTIQGAKKEKEKIRDLQRLDQLIHRAVESGILSNRDEIIEWITENGIIVNRVRKDRISVKFDPTERAKSLTGGVYSERFSSIEKLGEIIGTTERNIREYGERDRERELSKYQRELENYHTFRSERIAKRYLTDQPRDERNQTRERTDQKNTKSDPIRNARTDPRKDPKIQIRGNILTIDDRTNFDNREPSSWLYVGTQGSKRDMGDQSMEKRDQIQRSERHIQKSIFPGDSIQPRQDQIRQRKAITTDQNAREIKNKEREKKENERREQYAKWRKRVFSSLDENNQQTTAGLSRNAEKRNAEIREFYFRDFEKREREQSERISSFIKLNEWNQREFETISRYLPNWITKQRRRHFGRSISIFQSIWVSVLEYATANFRTVWDRISSISADFITPKGKWNEWIREYKRFKDEKRTKAENVIRQRSRFRM